MKLQTPPVRRGGGQGWSPTTTLAHEVGSWVEVEVEGCDINDDVCDVGWEKSGRNG